MTIQRLLEAAKRLAVGGHDFSWVTMDLDEHHVVDKAGYALRSRSGKIVVYRPERIANGNDGTVRVGDAEVDINGIVTSIRYDDKAPWWAVKPFTDAMEGK